MAALFEDQLLKENEAYAESFQHGDLPLPPSKKAAIITCMDSRLDPAAAYGLSLGSVIVIRNAGASAIDAARSALLSCHLLGAEEVFVVKHTKCGLLGATTAMAHTVMRKNLGNSAAEAIERFEVLPIADLQQSLEEDVAYLRRHALALDKVRVTGWIYDTETGRIKKVVE